MNRAERRRNKRLSTEPKTRGPQLTPKGAWKKMFFDSAPMVDGMPPHFLLYVLNEKEGFARYGKLVTATLWLQSQMVALICINEDAKLRQLNAVENGSHFPNALRVSATKKLETLSSEPLRKEFLRCFGSQMTPELQEDLEKVFLDRDGFSHGYVSLFSQIMGPGAVTWTPRSVSSRNKVFSRAVGPLGDGTMLAFNLSADSFEEAISRMCRIMDFISSILKQWNIPYVVFA